MRIILDGYPHPLRFTCLEGATMGEFASATREIRIQTGSSDPLATICHEISEAVFFYGLEDIMNPLSKDPFILTGDLVHHIITQVGRGMHELLRSNPDFLAWVIKEGGRPTGSPP